MADKFRISRKSRIFFHTSHRKTSLAEANGILTKKLYQFIKMNSEKILLDKDEHVRQETTLEKLSELPPAFKAWNGNCWKFFRH